MKIVDDSCFGQICHVGHVFKELVFRRILLLNLLRLVEFDFVVRAFDLNLAILFAEFLALDVADFLVRNPAGSLSRIWSVTDVQEGHFVQTEEDCCIPSGF